MRILGVGLSCDLGDMYLRCSAAGHEVRVYAADFADHGTMAGLVHFVDDYRAELGWVRAAGADGVIVFESTNHGEEQDALRREGFFVIGGSAFGDRLENDRVFGMAALEAVGLETAPMHDFSDFGAAIAFIERNPRRYVFKLHGNETSSWRNYVGQANDGSDLVALLRGQQKRLADVDIHDARFVLMNHLEGVEMGVGAYFDGQRFLTPACLDFEHKRFFAGDLGELTGEMGTLVTYQHSQVFFEHTLAKLAPQLRDGGYVGYINLNTIVNEAGVWPLELTCRFGYPGFAILDALQPAGWPDLFAAMREGRPSFPTAPGFAVGVVLTVPPFPFRYGYREISRGLPISFDATLSADARAHLHLGEVEERDGQLVASGITGYLMVVTGVGKRVEDAQKQAYATAAKVYVPNVRYRTDIGNKFVHTDHARLVQLGFLPHEAQR